MCVEFETRGDFDREPGDFEMELFEVELRRTMQRREAPASLKQKILLRRALGPKRRFASPWIFQWEPAMAVMVAMILVIVAAAAGVGEVWVKRQAEEQRRGEEAKQQVLMALRITGHALEQMNAQLEEQNRNSK
jgi:hypothetical protein